MEESLALLDGYQPHDQRHGQVNSSNNDIDSTPTLDLDLEKVAPRRTVNGGFSSNVFGYVVVSSLRPCHDICSPAA